MNADQCSPRLRRKIKTRLARIARETNELHELIRTEFPQGYVFFESAGAVCAMAQYRPVGGQRDIIETSPLANLDCGAW